MLFFNILLLVFYIAFKLFFMPIFNATLTTLLLQYLGVVIIALEVIFVVYDLALSYMIGYFDQVLRRIHNE